MFSVVRGSEIHRLLILLEPEIIKILGLQDFLSSFCQYQSCGRASTAEGESGDVEPNAIQKVCHRRSDNQTEYATEQSDADSLAPMFFVRIEQFGIPCFHQD
jgi:hypothetical protein